MHITGDQMQALHAAMQAGYARKICSELRDEIPLQTADYSDAELLETVKSALDKALRHGISSGDGVRRYVKLAVLIDPEFDEVPDVRRFLKLADLDADLKIKMLAELTAAQLRIRSL